MQGVLRVQRQCGESGDRGHGGFSTSASHPSRLVSLTSPEHRKSESLSTRLSTFVIPVCQSVLRSTNFAFSRWRACPSGVVSTCPRRVRCCYGAALGPAVLFRYLSFFYGPFRLFHITDYPYGFTVAVFVTLSLSLTGTRGDAAAGGTGTRDGPGEASSLLFLTIVCRFTLVP